MLGNILLFLYQSEDLDDWRHGVRHYHLDRVKHLLIKYVVFKPHCAQVLAVSLFAGKYPKHLSKSPTRFLSFFTKLGSIFFPSKEVQ